MLSNSLDRGTPSLHSGLAYRRPAEPQTVDEHLSRSPLRAFEVKEHLFSEGDTRANIYQVETGAVCLYKVLCDGRRQIVGFACAGDVIGLGAGNTHQFSAQAIKRSRVRSLPWATLQQASRKNPALGLELFQMVAEELSAARDLLLTTGQRTAGERVAAFLLAMLGRAVGRGEAEATVVLPMTRSDIGDLLGLTIETVSRTFTKLRKARVIDLEQSATVRFLDIPLLQDLANGESEQ